MSEGGDFQIIASDAVFRHRIMTTDLKIHRLIFDHEGINFCVLALPGQHAYEIVIYKNDVRVLSVGQVLFILINETMNFGLSIDPLSSYMEHVRNGIITIRSD